MNQNAENRQRIIRKRELINMIGLSDPTIWRMEKDGTFPKRIRLGGNSCGWLESEIMVWLAERVAARS
jgi:prophage regulatory protein